MWREGRGNAVESFLQESVRRKKNTGQQERIHTGIAHIHTQGATEESEDEHSAPLHQQTRDLT